MDSEKQYGHIEEEKLWESIKSGQGASHLNIPSQKSVPPMPNKNKEYKEKCSWVSVKDRLPEVNKEVFVYLFPNNVPYIAWWNGTHWQTDEFCLDDYLEEDEPLAWMPLPEPYKGDS